MLQKRVGIAIIGVLIISMSISSCTYRSYHPGYDYGYNSGYRHGYRYAPPPRVIVRPVPPPVVVYRNNGRSGYHPDRRSSRNFHRQSHRQYSHSGRSYRR